MSQPNVPYVVVLSIAALVCLLAVGLAWERREKDSAKVFGVLLVGAALWNLSKVGAELATDPWLGYTFAQSQYVGIPITATSWVVFALLYSDRGQYVTRGLLGGLAVEPILVNVVVWTNVHHELFWTLDAGMDDAIAGHGALFWPHAVYAWLLTVAGTVVILRSLVRSGSIFRRQGIVLSVASVIPLLGNLLFVTEATPVDLTPVGFAASAVLFFLAIRGIDVFSITPIARNTVVSIVDAGMVVVDREDRVVDLNAEARRLLDLESGADVVGRDLDALVDPSSSLGRHLSDPDPEGETVTVETDDGRRYYAVKGSAVRGRRGDAVGRVYLLHDVTDRERRQRELEVKNRQLDEFASLVSHDLRNPLSVAKGYVGEITDQADDETIETYADETATSLERMETLIDDVLAMARQSEPVGAPERTRLGDVARQAWAGVETAEMELVIEDDASVLADPDRLQQVFENLFRNAREHAGEAVTVTLGLTGLEGAHAPDTPGFVVADDGPGIAPDRRTEIFEQGYTTHEEGTGLGLAIVTRIAEAHGWSVELREGDGGAAFEFRGVDGLEPVDTPDSASEATE